MQTTKLYQALQILSPSDKKNVWKWLQSPFFVTNDILEKLFVELMDNISKEKAENVMKTEIWHKILPEQAYNDIRFRRYCSDLLKQLEDFWVWQYLEEHPLEKANYLGQVLLHKKKLNKHYQHHEQDLRQKLSRSGLRGQEYYKAAYETERIAT